MSEQATDDAMSVGSASKDVKKGRPQVAEEEEEVADKDCETVSQNNTDHEVAPGDTTQSTGNTTARNTKGTIWIDTLSM